MDVEIISYLLDGVKEDAPGLVQAIETYGHLTLSEYSSVFNTFTNTTVQSMSDFLEICQSYATRLLGEKTGINLAAHLKFCPVILTANHHGVEYISHAGQGSMIYALSIFFKRKQGIKGSNIVPIFSCGTIPLNNQSYPRGILLSRKVIKNYKTKGTLEKPVGITVFPNRLVKTVVNIAPPFTTTMVKSAIAKAANLYEKGIIHHKEIKTVTSVLSKDYLSDKILALKTYSDQAALLSHNLW
ncbi:hypothetical protein KAJ27_13665, partial [bacterium]|nr:hypothetical protein [bacterium]